MGEATYYAKFYFEDDKAAEAALPKLVKFIDEAAKAEDFWQENRFHLEWGDDKLAKALNSKEVAFSDVSANVPGEATENFFKKHGKTYPAAAKDWKAHKIKVDDMHRKLKKMAPAVYAYLIKYCPKAVGPYEFNNAVAGQMDMSGQDSHAKQIGSVIRYHATVWHFADWDPFMKWAKDELGAKKANWMSDEYVDPFDSL